MTQLSTTSTLLDTSGTLTALALGVESVKIRMTTLTTDCMPGAGRRRGTNCAYNYKIKLQASEKITAYFT